MNKAEKEIINKFNKLLERNASPKILSDFVNSLHSVLFLDTMDIDDIMDLDRL